MFTKINLFDGRMDTSAYSAKSTANRSPGRGEL